MLRFIALLSVGMLSCLVATPADAGIIQTATYNGHTYHLLNRTPTWEDAQAEALSLGGHLVTVNDAAENAWILATFRQAALDDLQAAVGHTGGYPSIWLGYFRNPDSTAWYWISGETSTYTNWASGEPAMGSPIEIKSGLLLTDALATAGLWHDIWEPPADWDYDYGLVEISSMSEVPEPASLTLFGLGSLGLLAVRRRRRSVA